MASAVFSVSSGQLFSGLFISVKVSYLYLGWLIAILNDPHLPGTHMLLVDN